VSSDGVRYRRVARFVYSVSTSDMLLHCTWTYHSGGTFLKSTCSVTPDAMAVGWHLCAFHEQLDSTAGMENAPKKKKQ